MDAVERVDVLILGARHFPIGSVKLPATMVADLPELVAQAQALNPAADEETVVRWIWDLGTRRVRTTLLKRIGPGRAALAG